MSKAVLISVKPNWVEKIHRGEKIWELRKSVPKTADAHLYKVYDYETKANGGRGKVVSEWILRECFVYFDDISNNQERNQVCKNACVSREQLSNYYNKGKHKVVYCWKIEELKIYEKPKELGEFDRPEIDLTTDETGSAVCPMFAYKKLTKAPQSWCYVRELEAV